MSRQTSTFSRRLARPLLAVAAVAVAPSALAQDGASPVPETGLNSPADRAPAGPLATRPATARPTTNPVTRTAQDLLELDEGGEAVAEEILPTIRLTPRDVRVPGYGRGRHDLAGTWNFVRDVPDSFDGTLASVDDWDQVVLPGHFMMHGYEPMHAEMGVPVAWGRTFRVPEPWSPDEVYRLRFESLDGKATVWVNGQVVGRSERVNLPVEFDITDALDVDGENEVVLSIERSLATHWAKRNLGSVGRGVYLQALPPVNLARTFVDTDLSDDLSKATMHVRLRVANDSAEPADDVALRFALEGPGGESHPTGLNAREVVLPPIAAGQMLETTVPIPVENFLTWDGEHPNLYRLTATLVRGGGEDGDETVMSATTRFGFREVQTTPEGELLLNGRPIKWRGTNYHMTYPGVGYFMSPEQGRADIGLFRYMNMNVLRVRPTPMIEYVDETDETGMYTTVEGMFTLMMYDRGPTGDHGADPAIAPGVREHMAAMLESYRGHPSILLYGLGNECPYYDYFRVAALGMKNTGVAEPLFFGSDDRLGVDIDFMDVNDDHYPRDGVATIGDFDTIAGEGWDYPKDRPNIFTEWGHIGANNIKEYTFDPGIDDFWGYYAQLHADWTYAPENRHILGGFLFLGAPERRLGSTFPWRGFFDEDRRLYDMAWHVKKSHSPVRIGDPDGRVDGEAVVVELDNRYDFRDLTEMSVTWEQGGRSGELDADLPAGERGTLAVPFDPAANGPTRLTFAEPDGHVVDIYEIGRNHLRTPPEPQPRRHEIEVERDGGDITIDVGDKRFVIPEDVGLVTAAYAGETRVLEGLPELVARATQFKNFRGLQKRSMVNQAYNWRADEVKVIEGDGSVSVVAAGKYDLAEGAFVTTIDDVGEMNVTYDFTWTGGEPFNCFHWGYAVRAPEPADTLVWERDAQWSYYPPDHIGRRQGVAPAGGDPQYAAARAAYSGEGRKPWPWAQDMIDGVTNDFRSTKLFFIEGGLVDDAGRGVLARARGGQHLSAYPVGGDLDGDLFVADVHGDRAGGYFLQVSNFYLGGSEPHLTKSITFGNQMIAPGTRLTGEAHFTLPAGR